MTSAIDADFRFFRPKKKMIAELRSKSKSSEIQALLFLILIIVTTIIINSSFVASKNLYYWETVNIHQSFRYLSLLVIYKHTSNTKANCTKTGESEF